MTVTFSALPIQQFHCGPMWNSAFRLGSETVYVKPTSAQTSCES
jgi:hypothetical protein